MNPRELILKANKAIKANNFILASELFTEILNRFPKHSAAKAGLKKVSKMNSNVISSVTQSELDILVNTLQNGDFQKTINLAKDLAVNDPNSAVVYNILGISYMNLNEPEKAVPNFKNALRVNKKYSEARGNLGAALLLLGNINGAVSCLQQVVRETPQNHFAWNSLGNAQKSNSMIEEAEHSFKQALNIEPNYASALNSYGVMLSGEGEYKKSIVQFEKALKIVSTDIEIFKNYIEALSNDEQSKKAIKLIKESPDQVRNAPAIQLALADIEIGIGNLEEGKNLLFRLIKTEPDYFAAYRTLSIAYRFKKTDNLLEKMKETFDERVLNESDTIQLGFALGKALHDIGEYDNAFNAYIRANEARRKELIYDKDDTNKVIEGVKRALDTKWINSVTKFGDKSTKPIFILGMNRSGTTLIEQILSSHSKVVGGGEIPFINKFCFRRIANLKTWENFDPTHFAKKYLEQLDQFDEHSPHVTDKMPANFYWLGLIKAVFPNAKIIHVTRDPMDTCLSNYRNYFSSFGNGHAYDQIELADFYHQYRQLMHHWYSAFPKEIFQCDYDQLIANQENVSRTLIDFCNLSWEPKVLDFHKNERTVKTASVTQVRNKIYTSSVSGWKKYEKHLQPMYELLNEKGCLEPWNVDSYN